MRFLPLFGRLEAAVRFALDAAVAATSLKVHRHDTIGSEAGPIRQVACRAAGVQIFAGLKWFAYCSFVIGLLIARSNAQTTATDPETESVRAQVAEAADRFDKYVFRTGENLITELVDKNPIHYTLLGYVGNDPGFDEIMFGSQYLHLLALPRRFSLTPDPKSADVVAVFADGPLDKANFSVVAELTGVGAAATRQDEQSFQNSCFLSHIYFGGRLQKTIATIDVTTAAQWPLAGMAPKRPLVPAACFLAGIVSHVGLHGVPALRPEEIVEAGRDTGRLNVRAPIIAVLKQLFASGVRVGMSREEAKKRVVDYLIPATREYLKWKGQNNGGHDKAPQ